MEIKFNTGSLHDQILRYPGPIVGGYDFLELVHLLDEVHLVEVVEDEGCFVLDRFGRDDDFVFLFGGHEEGGDVGGVRNGRST